MRNPSKYSFSLLHVNHVKLDHQWNYSHVISPYYRLYYIDEGEGFISNADQTLALEAGYIYCIPSFTLCHLRCPSYLSQYFIQFFEESPDGISLFHNNRSLMKVRASEADIACFKRMLQLNPGRGINRSDNPKVYEKSVYYKEYRELNDRQSMAASMETQGILLQLVARFLPPENVRSAGASSIPSKILDTMSYIQLNLKGELSVALLARRVNQHQDYFSRLFLQSTGERPSVYIQQKRIERAQYLMTTTSLSHAEIAAETGFDTLPYFSKIFRKVTSLTPGQYRKQHHQVNTSLR